MRNPHQEPLFDGLVTTTSLPERERHAVTQRLTVMATHLIDELGRDTPWCDLKDELKIRAAGKVFYNSDLIVAALDSALRVRRPIVNKNQQRQRFR